LVAEEARHMERQKGFVYPHTVIQRILRHANVSTTATYYIKTAADGVCNAMWKLEKQISESGKTLSDTNRTLNRLSAGRSASIQ
jgi:hypothetical protein